MIVAMIVAMIAVMIALMIALMIAEMIGALIAANLIFHFKAKLPSFRRENAAKKWNDKFPIMIDLILYVLEFFHW